MALVPPAILLTEKPGFIARSALYASYEAKKRDSVKIDRIQRDSGVARATFFRAIKEHEKGDKPDRYIPLQDSSPTEASDALPKDSVAQASCDLTPSDSLEESA